MLASPRKLSVAVLPHLFQLFALFFQVSAMLIFQMLKCNIRLSQPVLSLLGVCSHPSMESRAAKERERKSETSKKPLQTSLWNPKKWCMALSLSLPRHPWRHHPHLEALWLLLLAQVFLMQMLLFTYPSFHWFLHLLISSATLCVFMLSL